MRILAKIGGAQLEQPSARAALCASVAAARAAGHEVIVVHGGGNQIRTLVDRLGLEQRYHSGLRITDAPTADVVLMVLAGLVNKELVHALQTAGVRAAGMSGADGATFHARKLRAEVDLGYVGSVAKVNAHLVETLIDGDFTPVIATAAPLARGEDAADDHFYNINADMAAGPLARALDCDALLFLTDVVGVLDGDRERIESLSPERCAKLVSGGVITGGMIPKVDAAVAAWRENKDALVKIAPAAAPNCVLAALEPAVGTRFEETL
ncbi:MAG: acetylglutamate kinase [Planctomycetes bacterium]|nr:acetylglutamate kinase [Planctomycetota bacterium]